MGAEGRIGYLLKAFPVASETFILNELRAMEGEGVPLAILALKATPQPVEHAAVAELESPVERAPWPPPARLAELAGCHARLLLRRPGRYAAVCRRAVVKPLGRALLRPSAARRRSAAKGLRRFAWAGWVAERCRRLGVRHLHAHYAGEPLRVAELVRKMTGLPFSFTAHAKDLWTAPAARLRRALGKARFAVACHGEGAERLRELAPPNRRARVLRVAHGLDTRLFRPRPRRVEPGLLLAVGRLTAKKGFDDLLRACRLLAAAGRRFRCEIVGEGAQSPKLEALVRRHRLEERVRIRGFLPQEELPDLYARAALFVMPSRRLADGNRDGIPNVVLEAMACGRPVVATRAGAIPEAVADGVTGALVPPEDPGSLAAALARLLDRPERAEKLGAEGARRARELDFRETNRPLAARFGKLVAPRVEAALDRAERTAWRSGGIAARARKRLGVGPRRHERIEAAIRRSVAPGIAANAWRPDLERLALRRMWDEVFKARHAPRIQAALNGSGELPGAVLDLGCGRGGLAVALRARGIDVVGLDLRYRNCAVTGLRAERYGLQVPTLASRGETLPFADASFNSVCCLEVMEHVGDPVALLREIRRVLTPEGACALTVINRWAHHDPHYHLWGINFLPRALAGRYIDLRKRSKISYRDCQTLEEMHYFRYGSFLRLAASLGFRVVDTQAPEEGTPAAWLHALKRRLSLGFNAALVVLRPV